jgi:hypothetical protein
VNIWWIKIKLVRNGEKNELLFVVNKTFKRTFEAEEYNREIEREKEFVGKENEV